MKAIYTNNSDYGRDHEVVKKVRVFSFLETSVPDQSRRYGNHDRQIVAICIDSDGRFVTAFPHQLRVPVRRFPAARIRNAWDRLKNWVKNQTPAARAYRHGRAFIYGQFEKDENGVWVYPERIVVERVIEGQRYLRNRNFVKGMESVLNDWQFRHR